jgi:hypothetical protein
MDQQIATACIYAKPQGGTRIEGPSIRLAEIAASGWGNSRCGARVINVAHDYVECEGVMWDLERNLAITKTVRRPILSKKGERYPEHMIITTANAGCSIALRNAILSVIPKPLINKLYLYSRQITAGDVKTQPERLKVMYGKLKEFGITKQDILDYFDVKGEADINSDMFVTIAGMYNAITQDGLDAKEVFGKKEKPSTDGSLPITKKTKTAEPDPEPEVKPQRTISEWIDGVRAKLYTYEDFSKVRSEYSAKEVEEFENRYAAIAQ